MGEAGDGQEGEGRRQRQARESHWRGDCRARPGNSTPVDKGVTPTRRPGAPRWTRPWLVGESEPQEEVPPDELYEKLKRFQERGAGDIKEDEED